MLALVLSVFAAASVENAEEGSSPTPTLSPSSPPSRRPPWIGEACKQEFSTLCGHLPLNSQREAVIQCLKEHQESLSQDCATAISERRDAGQPSQRGRGSGRRRRGMGGGGYGGHGGGEVD